MAALQQEPLRAIKQASLKRVLSLNALSRSQVQLVQAKQRGNLDKLSQHHSERNVRE